VHNRNLTLAAMALGQCSGHSTSARASASLQLITALLPDFFRAINLAPGKKDNQSCRTRCGILHPGWQLQWARDVPLLSGERERSCFNWRERAGRQFGLKLPITDKSGKIVATQRQVCFYATGELWRDNRLYKNRGMRKMRQHQYPFDLEKRFWHELFRRVFHT